MFNYKHKSVGGMETTGSSTNSTNFSTNYVELYINYMLDKYGSNNFNALCTESTPPSEKHVFQNNNIIVRCFDNDQEEENSESPLSPFVEETQIYPCHNATTELSIRNREPLFSNETNNQTLPQLQTNTNESPKKDVIKQCSISSKFVLHTPTEIEKKIEEKAQWAGKRGRGRPRKNVVDKEKISKKNKTTVPLLE
ncbi:hypothetical protein ABK040_014794 [Willaertia magna]